MKEFQKLLKQNDYRGAAERLLFLVFRDGCDDVYAVPRYQAVHHVRARYDAAQRTRAPAMAIAKHGTAHGEALYLIYAPVNDGLAFTIVAQGEYGADIVDRLQTYSGAMANFIAAVLVSDMPEPEARYRLLWHVCEAPAGIDAQKLAENGGCARR